MNTTFLTNEELHELQVLIHQLGIDRESPNESTLEAPTGVVDAISATTTDVGSSMGEEQRIELLLAAEAIGAVRLSHETRHRIVSRLTEIKHDRQKRRNYRWDSRRRKSHWKTRLGIFNKRKGDRWRKDSLSCIISLNKFRCKRIDREEWDREVGWIWKEYHPNDIKFRFKKGSGTKKEPWRLSCLMIWNRKTGKVLFNGNDYLLYRLSAGRGYD